MIVLISLVVGLVAAAGKATCFSAPGGDVSDKTLLCHIIQFSSVVELTNQGTAAFF